MAQTVNINEQSLQAVQSLESIGVATGVDVPKLLLKLAAKVEKDPKLLKKYERRL